MRIDLRSWLVLLVGIVSAACVAALLAFSDGHTGPTAPQTMAAAKTVLADSTRAQDAMLARLAVERQSTALERAREAIELAQSRREHAEQKLADAQQRIDKLTAQVRRLQHQLEIKRATKKRAAQHRRQLARQHRSSGWAIPRYIVMCESGGNYRAENPTTTASGAYQILDSTWAAYGGIKLSGIGHAASAAPWQQDEIARRIWNGGAGAGQWSCA
jgi:TolA-binding protein